MNYKFFLIKKLLIINFFLFFNVEAFKITRAIISWDYHPNFNHLWPIVSKAWSTRINIRPTLIFIGSKIIKLDNTYGDVVYFQPIPNIPTSFQAKTIRPLAAALFPNDICILSDLDMIPINKDYFIQSVADFPDDCFVVFYPNFYKDKERYMMCYNAAKGSTFKEIFKINNVNDIRNLLITWYKIFFRIYDYKTDEKMLYRYLYNWKRKKRKLKLLNLKFKRLNREQWQYDPEHIIQGNYADAHILRPYYLYKKEIDELLALLNLK